MFGAEECEPQKKQPKWRLMEAPKRGNQLKSIGADAAADVAPPSALLLAAQIGRVGREGRLRLLIPIILM